jgi:hypothetical protein
MLPCPYQLYIFGQKNCLENIKPGSMSATILTRSYGSLSYTYLASNLHLSYLVCPYQLSSPSNEHMWSFVKTKNASLPITLKYFHEKTLEPWSPKNIPCMMVSYKHVYITRDLVVEKQCHVNVICLHCTDQMPKRNQIYHP